MNEGTFAVEIMPQVFSLFSKGDSEVVAAARCRVAGGGRGQAPDKRCNLLFGNV